MNLKKQIFSLSKIKSQIIGNNLIWTVLENKNGRSFIYRLSPEAADIIIGAGDIFQVRVSVESLSRIPILLSYLLVFFVFLGRTAKTKAEQS